MKKENKKAFASLKVVRVDVRKLDLRSIEDYREEKEAIAVGYILARGYLP